MAVKTRIKAREGVRKASVAPPVESLLGDPSKAKRLLGWSPTTRFDELVAETAAADFVSAQRDALVKKAGFQAFDYNE